ncbi:MAG: dihydrofolate reductase [Prevotella sp.]
MGKDNFQYIVEDFADIRILRYRLDNFDKLSVRQKLLVYYLSEAALSGRDITTDQFGKHNLLIRRILEAIYTHYKGNRETADFKSLEVYLKRIWFSNGIYHHYGSEKFKPDFSKEFFIKALQSLPTEVLPLEDKQSVSEITDILKTVIFDTSVNPVKVCKKDGEDIVVSSACNFYEGVTQQEVEDYYAAQKDTEDKKPVSYGLNTTVCKTNGKITEVTWRLGNKYDREIRNIIKWLKKAEDVAENPQQKNVIQHLIKFYETGDLKEFNRYCIEWVREAEAEIDFINGFIEVYDDPLGLKGTWEGLVEYLDIEGTKRTRLISDNAQWFEDHSPIDPRFKKKTVKGVSAKVICAAMLGGGEYPATAIGINLPNADWIRAEYGSKSITISNIISAYNEAARGNGFDKEFVIDEGTCSLINKYGNICDIIHTDLHECLGHGSGQLLKGVSPDALKAYGNTIEEARADLFALYYQADSKLVDLGLMPDKEAYKAAYYSFMMNGLLTQMARIQKGHDYEEAHMRNRALIARWCHEHGSKENITELTVINGKTFVRINDYEKLRKLFARLLAEIQRIKSEGDFEAARHLVEKYAVRLDPQLHEEITERYNRLKIPPYKGFINPTLKPITDSKGNIIDIDVDYTETYTQQMLRYGREY